MPRRKWVSLAGRVIHADMPDRIKAKNLSTVDIKDGDIVGIKIQNQSSSGTMCAHQTIQLKKHLKLPAGEFTFEITKLRGKPTSISSEIRDYLGEL